MSLCGTGRPLSKIDCKIDELLFAVETDLNIIRGHWVDHSELAEVLEALVESLPRKDIAFRLHESLPQNVIASVFIAHELDSTNAVFSLLCFVH